MVIESNLESIDEVVEYLKAILEPHTIVLLNGTLASGKTTLVKNLVKSLGISESVTSPTFAIQTVYDSRVYHYDIYNKSLDEFISLGLLEELDRDAIHIIEWAGDRLEDIVVDYGFYTIKIDIEVKESSRVYKIERIEDAS
jgi:tRNA threonylcarbamoyladenosine biosynthesis protein TsaE